MWCTWIGAAVRESWRVNITLKETLEEARQRLGNGGGLFLGAWVNRGAGSMEAENLLEKF